MSTDAAGALVVDRRSAIDDESAARARGGWISTNCFECAKANDTVAAVGVCRHCGVGLCLDHLIETQAFTVGATNYSCPHEVPRVKPLRGLPAGIAHTGARFS